MDRENFTIHKIDLRHKRAKCLVSHRDADGTSFTHVTCFFNEKRDFAVLPHLLDEKIPFGALHAAIKERLQEKGV